jgi:hypothetical protein
MADDIESVVPIVAAAPFPLTALSNLARDFRIALHDTDCVHAASFCLDSDTSFALALLPATRHFHFTAPTALPTFITLFRHHCLRRRFKSLFFFL